MSHIKLPVYKIFIKCHQPLVYTLEDCDKRTEKHTLCVE